MTCTDRLSLLPDELLLRVFSLVEPRDVAAVFQTCQRLKRIADDVGLWFNVYDNEPLPLPPKQAIEIKDARKTISEAHLLARYLNQSGNSRSRRPAPSFRFIDEDIVNPYDSSIYASYLVSERYLVLAFARSCVIRCYDISEAVPMVVCGCPLAGPGTPSSICSAPSSLNNPASDGWVYLPIERPSSIDVYRLALRSLNAAGPLLQFFTRLDNASLLPSVNPCESIYIPIIMEGRYCLFSPASNQMCELKTETRRPNVRVILAPHYAIIWWFIRGSTIFEVFVFPESSAPRTSNILNITHCGQLDDVRCRYCVTMQYLNKCDSSLLLTTEIVHDDSSSDPYSPTYRLAVYQMDFQDDGRLGLKELHCFSLRNPSYLLRANTVIKRHGMIFLISLQSHNPHYIVLTLQCDTTGKDWEFEFKKESMAVLHVDGTYSVFCNATKGELLWIDKNTTMFKHRLIDETQ